MMYGYLDDALLEGGQDPGFFRIWHWHCVDVFVYFSHHFVTVPPPGWIDAAHKSGVKVCVTLLLRYPAALALCWSLDLQAPRPWAR